MSDKSREMKRILCIVLLIGYAGHAQDTDKETKKAIKKSAAYTWEGNKNFDENDFVNAEANYRKAISENAENSIAPYNLGNAYYKNETYSEAFGRFKQAAENATEKTDKHNAFHNMGNVFMKNKEYEKAVEAYKEALRNDPTDEETRYNFALAKEMLKKEQEEQQNNPDKDDQDQEDNKDQENQDQQDKDQQEQENKDDQQDNQDQDEKEGDQGDQGDQEKEEDKEGEGDPKEENEKQPDNGEQQEQPQPRPNQLSPQQVKNLLEAMQNEEKKVQEKIDAQSIKGPKVKNEKDW